MWDIVIDCFVEGHDPRHGPHRNLGVSQKTPEPELARIGMAFLEVIDLAHQGQPDLAGRGLGCTALVEQARNMLRRKPRHPASDLGPAVVLAPTAAEFPPPCGG